MRERDGTFLVVSPLAAKERRGLVQGSTEDSVAILFYCGLLAIGVSLLALLFSENEPLSVMIAALVLMVPGGIVPFYSRTVRARLYNDGKAQFVPVNMRKRYLQALVAINHAADPSSQQELRIALFAALPGLMEHLQRYEAQMLQTPYDRTESELRHAALEEAWRAIEKRIADHARHTST